jgi:hypothetical protein
MPLGQILGAAGALFSGFGARKSAKSAAAAQERANQQNIQLQKDFAQKGIRWRVADAKKAGIHPLYAIGANTPTFSPSVQSVGDSGAGLGSQAVGRAIAATGGALQHNKSYQKAVEGLTIRRMELENTKLASDIAVARQGALTAGPLANTHGNPLLLEGQPMSGAVTTKPMQRESARPGNLSQEAGYVTDLSMTRSKNPHEYNPVMSHDAKDRLEEDTIGMLNWNLRNRLLPYMGYNLNPPDYAPKKNHEWYMDWKGSYRQRKKKPRRPYHIPGLHYIY